MPDSRALPRIGQNEQQRSEGGDEASPPSSGFGEIELPSPELETPESSTRPAAAAQIARAAASAIAGNDDATRVVFGDPVAEAARALEEDAPTTASSKSRPSRSSHHSGSESGVASRDPRVAAMRELYANGDADGALELAQSISSRPAPLESDAPNAAPLRMPGIPPVPPPNASMPTVPRLPAVSSPPVPHRVPAPAVPPSAAPASGLSPRPPSVRPSAHPSDARTVVRQSPISALAQREGARAMPTGRPSVSTRPPSLPPPPRTSSSSPSRASSPSSSNFGEVDFENFGIPTAIREESFESNRARSSLPTAPPRYGNLEEEKSELRARLPVLDIPPPPPSTVLLTLTQRQAIPRLLKAPSELSSLPIDHRAGFLLAHMDGIHTMEEIFDICPMPAEEAWGLIQDLERLGVIRVE